MGCGERNRRASQKECRGEDDVTLSGEKSHGVSWKRGSLIHIWNDLKVMRPGGRINTEQGRLKEVSEAGG